MRTITQLLGAVVGGSTQRGVSSQAAVEPLEARRLLSASGHLGHEFVQQTTTPIVVVNPTVPTVNITGTFVGSFRLRQGNGAGLGFTTSGTSGIVVGNSVPASLSIDTENPDGTVSGTLVLGSSPFSSVFAVNGQVVGRRLVALFTGNGVSGTIAGRVTAGNQLIRASFASTANGVVSTGIARLQRVPDTTINTGVFLGFNTTPFVFPFNDGFFFTTGFANPAGPFFTNPLGTSFANPAFSSSLTPFSSIPGSSSLVAGSPTFGSTSVFSSGPMISLVGL